MEIWHDRAVLHFLISPDDRARSLAQRQRTLKVDGSAIVATFGPYGPGAVYRLACGAVLAGNTGGGGVREGFILVDTLPYEHRTPRGSTQVFQYSRLRRVL